MKPAPSHPSRNPSETVKRSRSEALDRCDEALTNYPILSNVYSPCWRESVREQFINAPEITPVALPVAYGCTLHPQFYPDSFQARIEGGLDIIRVKAPNPAMREYSKRLKNRDAIVAVDELLTIRGFSVAFGQDAVEWEDTGSNTRQPECWIRSGNLMIGVECCTLFDRAKIRIQRHIAQITGTPMVVPEALPAELDRLRHRIVEKIKRQQGGRDAVVMICQHAIFLNPNDAATLVKHIYSHPEKFEIQAYELPLAIGYVAMYRIQSIFFRTDTAVKIQNTIKTGVHEAFWPNERSCNMPT